MRLSQRQSQKQQLTLNQSLVQGIELLSLPLQDLEQQIKEELEENPLLETRIEPIDTKNIILNESLYSHSSSYSDSNEKTAVEIELAEEKNIFDELILQSRYQERTEPVQKCLEYLIYSLDEKGYLPNTEEELLIASGASQSVYEQARQALFSLEPKGLGAYNLKECLILQLDPEEKEERFILESSYEQILQGNFEDIAKKTGLSLARVRKAFKRIAELNPYPLNGWGDAQNTPYVIPEATVVYEGSAIIVEMTKSWITGLRVITKYDGRLQEVSKQDRDYILEKKQEARSLIANLYRRQKTMEQILTTLVEWQHAFFEKKSERPKILTQKKLAKILDLDESTISRAIHDKYIICDRGLIRLSSLFPKNIENSKGENLEKVSLIEKLKSILNNEEREEPLSDEDIVRKLQENGYSISRRTVTKYRETIGVPNHYERRKLYQLSNNKKS